MLRSLWLQLSSPCWWLAVVAPVAGASVVAVLAIAVTDEAVAAVAVAVALLLLLLLLSSSMGPSSSGTKRDTEIQRRAPSRCGLDYDHLADPSGTTSAREISGRI